MTIGRLERVPLREVWKHEALDFTRWLQDNADVVNDAIGMELANVEREQPAGAFSVDLLGEDPAGNPVIIENQLEKSDHDHLGKLITYLTAYEAKVAIWIVADARMEHISAINWLNESTSASFYLFKVEAVRIGDSKPAPLLTLLVGPTVEGREAGETKKEFAERRDIRWRFWHALIERAREKTQLHANISPNSTNWISAGSGRSGVAFNYVVLRHSGRVEYSIDSGDRDTNLSIFDELYLQKDEIESAFGQHLDWDRPPEGRKMARIQLKFSSGGYMDEERWADVQDQLINAMIRLERALRPYIDQLPR